MTPDDYESLVTNIATGLAAGSPELQGCSLGCGAANRHLGASGYRHQIDVSLTGPGAIYLIEAKRWARRVSVQAVMVLAARASDIAMHLGAGTRVVPILVSQHRATRGAQRLADHFGVALECVQSPLVYGMQLGRLIVVGLHERVQMGDHVSAEVAQPETPSASP